MAVNWKKFQETKNTYPNLEYTPSRAANPRDSHRVYWGKIWAIDDPIWDTIMPPSEWNCFCGVRPTNKPVTVLPDGWQQPETDPARRSFVLWAGIQRLSIWRDGQACQKAVGSRLAGMTS